MKTISLRKMMVAIALVGVSTACVRADKMQLQEKLGKNISIKLKDVTITEALNKIGQESGVKIVLSDEAAWKLPQGEATRLSVSLDGPLAGSITEMLNAFFMRYAAGDEEITIYPRPELDHILGRPTTKQLELLKAIYTKPINVHYLEQAQKTINTALDQQVLITPISVLAQVDELLSQLLEGTPINREKPTELILPIPVTLAQLLNQISITGEEPVDTRWYISGMDFPSQSPEIRIVHYSTFNELKLNQKVDISYKDEKLNKIFQDLAGRAGIELTMAPGSYLHDYTLSVNMQNITISQAIKNIADMVGARCDVTSEWIEIAGPGPKKPERTTPEPRATTGKSDDGAYVGKISIPMDNGKYFIEFMLREKDLTEQLQKIRAEKMKEILGDLPEQKTAEEPK